MILNGSSSTAAFCSSRRLRPLSRRMSVAGDSSRCSHGLLDPEAAAYSSLDDYYLALWLEDAPRDEVVELLELLDARSTTRSHPSALAPEVPLVVHARYTGTTWLAALGLGEGAKPPFSREGLIATPDERYDAFFVDLQKAERDYSPTTMYRDYAINRELFHWESQSMQTDKQRRVLRWIEHQQRGGNVLLFVRDKKRSELGTQAFTFLGPVTYVDHRGERPVAFTSAPPDPDAGRALRSRTKRRGRVEAAVDELETFGRRPQFTTQLHDLMDSDPERAPPRRQLGCLHARDDVRVPLQREGRRLVPELFAHHIHRDSGLQGQRRVRMPQIVQPDPSDSSLPQSLSNDWLVTRRSRVRIPPPLLITRRSRRL